jgi:hypothetical protein
VDTSHRIFASFAYPDGGSWDSLGVARFAADGIQDEKFYQNLRYDETKKREVFDAPMMSDNNIFGVGYVINQSSDAHEKIPALFFFKG